MLIDDLSLKNNIDLATVGPDASVSDAVALLKLHNVGALPVCDATGALIGILSERDIVRGLPDSTVNLNELKVADLMTADVVTCSPEDDLEEIMTVMNDRKIRHVPVMIAGKLSTIVSSRDVMYASLEETKSHATTMSLAYEMVR